MKDKKPINRRNKNIYEDYQDLFFIKMMREEAIWDQLGEKYYLLPESVYRIILAQRKEAAKTQTLLPLQNG